MVSVWRSVPEASHGFLVLPAFAYLVWRKRRELDPLSVLPWSPARILLFAAFLCYLAGKQSGLASLYRTASVFLVLFAALRFLGIPVVRKLGSSFLLLFFMIPPPRFFLAGVSIPLQKAATHVSCALASALGVRLTFQGTTILLPAGKLEIEAACSGLRGIITLVLIAVFLGELRNLNLRTRALLVLAGVLAALALNVVRILTTVLLVDSFGLETATGSLHETLGLSIIVVGSVFLAFLSSRFEPTAEAEP